MKYSKYNIPISELIIQEGSSYTIYLTSTDNYINTITEKIIIKYSVLTPDEQTTIKNYCNSYDTIELQYKLQCTYNKETMILKNQFNLNKLNKNIKIGLCVLVIVFCIGIIAWIGIGFILSSSSFG